MRTAPFKLHHAFLVAALATLTACGGDDDTPPAANPPLGAPTLAFTPPSESLDLSNYTLTGQYTLPVATGAGVNQIAAEVSAVTYDLATDSLYIVGDEGTYITRLSKTGQVLDTMSLPAGLFADPEGITSIGNGQFVVADERVRTANLFTYRAGTTLDAATVRTVKLAPTVGNVGLEGVTFDPMTGGYVFVKEISPKGIFQTTIDFTAGTASNGPVTSEPTNLFDPEKLDVADFGDIYAMSNAVPASAADHAHLIILSNDTGRILKTDRAGRVYGSLDILQSAQHEGITFDKQLNMYVTNEAGGGSQALPQLWVYAPTRSANAVGLGSHLYLNFAGDVKAGTGNITVIGAGGDTRTIAVTDTTQVTISGSTVKINPTADLVPNTAYSVQFASGVFRDAQGVATQAVSDAKVLAFTSVPDTTAPLLLSSTPLDNATAVAAADSITLTFNEPVKAGTGAFTISNGADDVRTIPAADAQVSVNGTTVTINPTADLLPGTGYHVLVAATAVTDAAGNAFKGIADTTALNFVTAGTTPPTVLNAGDLLFIAVNADSTDAFAFILMRDITAGTQIGFSDRDSLTATNESAFMWTADRAFAAGTIVTVLPDAATPTTDKGGIVGSGGGISTSSETIFAFQGSIPTLPVATGAPTLVVDRYIAAINMGTAGGLDTALQAALNPAGAFIAFTPDDNVRYNGMLSIADPAALRAAIANTANWVRNDTTAFPITAGSLYP